MRLFTPMTGYDELQSTMAKYFGAPWQHPADHFGNGCALSSEECRSRDLSPSTGGTRDRLPALQERGGRATGGGKQRHPDPVRINRSAQGQSGRPSRRGGSSTSSAFRGFKFHPDDAGFLPERSPCLFIRFMKRSRRPASRRCSILGRPASAPGCAPATTCGLNIRTRCTSTTLQSISRT